MAGQSMNRGESLHQVATALPMASDDYVHAVGDIVMTLARAFWPAPNQKERALYDASLVAKALVPTDTALLCDDFVEISIKIPRDPTDGFDEDDAERMNMVRLALASRLQRPHPRSRRRRAEIDAWPLQA